MKGYLSNYNASLIDKYKQTTTNSQLPLSSIQQIIIYFLKYNTSTEFTPTASNKALL